jgi:hypothetical protein
MPVVPALGRLGREICQFKANLALLLGPVSKTKQKNGNRNGEAKKV